MTEKCAATTKAGKPCPSAARAGRAYCLMHDPDAAEERRAAGRKGGHNKSHAARAERRMILAKPYDVHVVLGTSLRAVFDGDMDPGTAAALATLGRATLLAIEKSTLEKRIAELERRAGIAPEEGQ